MPSGVYRTLFEQSPFSTQVFGPDGSTLRVNAAWEALWGVTLDSIAGYNILHDPQLVAKGVMPYIERGFAGEAVAIPAILYNPNETIPNRTTRPDPGRWVVPFSSHQERAGRPRASRPHSRGGHGQKDAEVAQEDLRQRLVALTDAAGRLFASLAPDDVLLEIVGLGRELVAADGGAMWRLNPGTDEWRAVKSWGVSEAFASRIIPSNQGTAVRPIGSSEPIIVPDVDREPSVEERLAEYHAEGVRSMLAMPIGLGGTAAGSLAFYFRDAHRFSDTELRTARALANLAAAAMATSDAYESLRLSRERAEQANREAEFLARAGATLAASLDYEETLRLVAGMAVPYIADWCGVDIVTTSGAVQRLAVAHVNPEKVELIKAIETRYPSEPGKTATERVIRSSQPELVSVVTDGIIGAAARDAEHARLLRSLRLTSYMCVPLVAHGRTLGALVFASAESGRTYTADDLRFAQDVAYRAALAVDNSRAYQDAAQANQSKDEFLAVLSHELRTPLSAILGWARMLRGGQVRDTMRGRALESIERNAVLQARLVDDILDVARSLTGKLHIEPAPLDFIDVIRHAVDAISHAALAKAIHIDVRTPEAVPIVGDAGRLEQIVWNLLSNAVKFTPADGHIRVLVETDERELSLTVSDTGLGISPEFLPHVFDKFRQADASFARRTGGLGLGLAIVRDVAELHGGRVAAESAGEGRGATFRVTLPRLPGANDGAGVPTPLSARADTLRTIDVLIVDDDADTREMAAMWLEQHGAAVRTAASAAEGDLRLADRRCDVIVIDLAMPGVDGYRWLQQLRAAGSPVRDIPAIAFSAHAQPRDRRAAARAGFDLHIAKPADVDALVDGIVALVRRRRSPQG